MKIRFEKTRTTCKSSASGTGSTTQRICSEAGGAAAALALEEEEDEEEEGLFKANTVH